MKEINEPFDKKRNASTTGDELTAPLPMGMQKTREVSVDEIEAEEESNVFLPEETGEPDADPVPDLNNPLGVQGLRGPLNEEGQGDRQNAELAELQQIEPDLELDKPS